MNAASRLLDFSGGHRVVRRASVLTTAIALSGCGAAPAVAKAPEKCGPQVVTVSILTSPRVNPTPSGEPRAVVVRLYQLKSDVRLSNARFEQVWRNDKTTLGDELVKVDEQEVYPGSRVDVKFDRSEAVQNIAAVALFQNPQGRSWVTGAELPPVSTDGACDAPACDDADEACRARGVAAPRLSFFLDGNKIDDGVEHLDEFPTVGSIRGRQ